MSLLWFDITSACSLPGKSEYIHYRQLRSGWLNFMHIEVGMPVEQLDCWQKYAKRTVDINRQVKLNEIEHIQYQTKQQVHSHICAAQYFQPIPLVISSFIILDKLKLKELQRPKTRYSQREK